MSCTCDINIKYGYDPNAGGSPFTNPPAGTTVDYNITMASTGTRNGKSSYSWNDGVLDRIIFWDNVELRWTAVKVLLSVEYPIAYFTVDINCPGYELVPGETLVSWTWDSEQASIWYYSHFTVSLDCPGALVEAEIAEQKNCYRIQVWKLQCSFAKKVETYFNNLSYGIPSTCSLNDLQIEMYGLQVLNNYNPNDIYYNTTNYNIITYTEIQNILTKLN